MSYRSCPDSARGNFVRAAVMPPAPVPGSFPVSTVRRRAGNPSRASCVRRKFRGARRAWLSRPRRSARPRKRAGWANADDGVRHTIQRNAATDYAWVAAHPFLPKNFRHHGDVGAFFFLRQEIASPNRTHPKNIKIIRGDPAAEDLHRIAQSCQSESENVFRTEAVEDCLRFPVVLETGCRDCELEKFALAGVRIHVHHTRRLFER